MDVIILGLVSGVIALLDFNFLNKIYFRPENKNEEDGSYNYVDFLGTGTILFWGLFLCGIFLMLFSAYCIGFGFKFLFVLINSI